MFLPRPRIVASSILISALTMHAARTVAQHQGDDLAAIAASLRNQDAAWDDLSVKYTCEAWSPQQDGAFNLSYTKHLHWRVTQPGWEKIERTTPAGSAPHQAGDWVEAATYNGEFYMTWDSQNQGSGSIGHRLAPFLSNTHSPKIFGLIVTGLELSYPVSLADFLVMKESRARIVATEGEFVVVQGDDPLADGWSLKLWLNPAIGYRPAKIDLHDKRGLASRYDPIEYRKLSGARGDFWFPVRGVWHGVNPEDRSFGTQTRYALESIDVDTHPDRSQFVLSFPKGALLANADTGETHYTTTDTSPEDVPLFAGKLMSMAEHDTASHPAAHVERARRSAAPYIVAINLVLLTAAAVVLWLRRRRQPNRGAS